MSSLPHLQNKILFLLMLVEIRIATLSPMLLHWDNRDKNQDWNTEKISATVSIIVCVALRCDMQGILG